MLRAGYEVVGVDDLSTGDRTNIPNGVRFIEKRIEDLRPDDLVGNLDGCLHFAGRIEVGESMNFPQLFREKNIVASSKLFSSLIDSGIRKIVFSSSAAIYKSNGSALLNEDSVKSPVSVYGETKLETEAELLKLSGRNMIRVAILRYFNAAGSAYGHRENHLNETHLIPRLIEAALKGTTVEIYGTHFPTVDGTCVRDYVHVKDLAIAHRLAFEKLDKTNQLICNLGTGSGTSVLQVVDVVEGITNRKIHIKYIEPRSGDSAFLVADASRARIELGWEPQFSEIEDIINSVWHEMRNSS